ncbi:MAG: Fic family protein [Reyranellaceae bacterium]
MFSSEIEENMYIWQRRNWPDFTWNDSALIAPLASARLAQGELLGLMRTLGFELRREAQLHSLTEEVVKTSEIEGETLDHASVRSSLARRLGIRMAGAKRIDRRAEGVVEMALDATRDFDRPLTPDRLFAWHRALLGGEADGRRIAIGCWRDDAAGPMQVISGAVGRERVHFEAPPAARLDTEMRVFLAWFAAAPRQDGRIDGLLRAGLAHLWFVTIHPFDDGNGRIARAIAEMALAQSENSPQRFYSMSAQIRRERADYYRVLERTQRGGLDVTDWLAWFLGCFTRAVQDAQGGSSLVLRKAAFWRRHEGTPLNERQRAILNRCLDGFQGNITAKKWATLGKVSLATAQRDILDLVGKTMLAQNPGGSKNTSYSLRLDDRASKGG